MSKLIIVESPAKANTIKKYLGKEFDVTASMGHVRDLPAAKLSVDIKKDFMPKYAVIKGKEKLVKELIPNKISLGALQRILQNLLQERVSIRDLPSMLYRLNATKLRSDSSAYIHSKPLGEKSRSHSCFAER